jgi:hypothetical protein
MSGGVHPEPIDQGAVRYYTASGGGFFLTHQRHFFMLPAQRHHRQVFSSSRRSFCDRCASHASPPRLCAHNPHTHRRDHGGPSGAGGGRGVRCSTGTCRRQVSESGLPFAAPCFPAKIVMSVSGRGRGWDWPGPELIPPPGPPPRFLALFFMVHAPTPWPPDGGA